MPAPAARPTPPPGAGRLFAALWPDDATREALVAWQRAVVTGPRARPTPPRDLHATLAFLGDPPPDRLPAIAAALDLPGPPITLALDAVEHWPRGLVVAVPSALPRALRDWQAALADRLAAIGLPREDRPYRPHVTLARDASPARAAIPVPPIAWTPTGHVLAVRDGAHDRVIRSYD